MKKVIFILCDVILCSSVSFTQTTHKTTHPLYTVANKIPVEGEGNWDLVTMDEPNWRLYLSHGQQAQALDVRTGKVIGSVTAPYTKGVHGIAIANDLNKGFISNGKDSSVTAFDLTSLKLYPRIKVTGANPDMILYDSFSHDVITFNGKSSNATIIKADSNKVIGTISLPGKPELAVSDEKGKIYLNIEDKNSVCVIDSKTWKIENTWKIAPGEEATGIALDTKAHRLFLVCGNKRMIILDSDNGKFIQSLPIGDKADGVAFDPFLKRIYSSNGEGTLTVIQEINENTFNILETVTTQKGAKTIALDTRTHFIYLPVAEYLENSKDEEKDPKAKPMVKPNSFRVLVVKLDE